MSVSDILAVSSLSALAYTYIGYPAILFLICAAKGGRRNQGSGATARNRIKSSVSVVVCVRNAEGVIAGRINNLLKQDEVPDEFEIVIASDGSTDATVRAVTALAHPRVKVLDFKENRGKSAVLNEVIPACRGDIVVLTDARQEFAPDAIASLCRNFENPEIGAVSGELVFRDGPNIGPAAEGVGAYWRYEKTIRRLESCVDSTCGCTGAIYAIRRSLFRPIDPAIVLDDVAIPMLILLQGKRVAFDDRAVAFDKPSADFASEKRRKIRTLAGNFQLCAEYPELMNPFKNRIFPQFVSHKILRLLCPYFLAILFLASAFMSFESATGKILFGGQVVFYLLAAFGSLLNRGKLPGLISVPAAFVHLNYAAVAGAVCFACGRIGGTWTPTGSE